MKKMIACFICMLVIYSVYQDITHGSISTPNPVLYTSYKTPEVNQYTLIEVKRGDTVLSIMDKQLTNQSKVPLEQIKKDFIELNNGIEPTEVKQGKIYKFPLYP